MNHTHSKKSPNMRHQGEPDSNDYFCTICAKIVDTDE